MPSPPQACRSRSVAPIGSSRRAGSGQRPGSLLRPAGVLVLGLASLGLWSASAAAVMGGARAVPYDQALGRTRDAAKAVITRAGTESCLRGKLTNALLQMVSSCEAAGQRNSLCELSNRAVVQPTWSLEFMEATARDVLELINDRPPR
ncbi:MAG: hypothetical protein MUD04_06895 [Cyanobium sp. Prado107]|nr:hypothetical protein [Cyanobium sp. Prado107]